MYRLEAFASTEPALASNGVVFVRFDLAQGTNGNLAVEVDAGTGMRFRGQSARRTRAACWRSSTPTGSGSGSAPWPVSRPGTSATLAVPTKAARRPRLRCDCSQATYAEQRATVCRDVAKDSQPAA